MGGANKLYNSSTSVEQYGSMTVQLYDSVTVWQYVVQDYGKWDRVVERGRRKEKGIEGEFGSER